VALGAGAAPATNPPDVEIFAHTGLAAQSATQQDSKPRSMTALLAMLALLGPIVVHDAGERSPLASAGERPGTVASEPVVYERRTGPWVQWWLLFPRNDQDRGILHAGRHAGDWEMVRCDATESAIGVALPAIALLVVVAVRRRRSSRDAEHLQP
jgi:uncharacterized protein (TIGR03382 family)